jgi:hypothetical protein
MLTAFSVASYYISVEGVSDNVGCFEFYSGCAGLFPSKPAPTRGLSRVGGSDWRGYLDAAERPIQTYSVMTSGAWREAASRSIKPLPYASLLA